MFDFEKLNSVSWSHYVVQFKLGSNDQRKRGARALINPLLAMLTKRSRLWREFKVDSIVCTSTLLGSYPGCSLRMRTKPVIAGSVEFVSWWQNRLFLIRGHIEASEAQLRNTIVSFGLATILLINVFSLFIEVFSGRVAEDWFCPFYY